MYMQPTHGAKTLIHSSYIYSIPYILCLYNTADVIFNVSLYYAHSCSDGPTSDTFWVSCTVGFLAWSLRIDKMDKKSIAQLNLEQLKTP